MMSAVFPPYVNRATIDINRKKGLAFQCVYVHGSQQQPLS